MSTKHGTCKRFVLCVCLVSIFPFQHIRVGSELEKNDQSPNYDPWNTSSGYVYSTAQLYYTYEDPQTRKTVAEFRYALYSTRSPHYPESGELVHVVNEHKENHGCHPFANAPVNFTERWIALIRRGQCKFHNKVANAMIHQASAVVVYNNMSEPTLLTMHHPIDDIVSVFISKEDGLRLVQLVDAGVNISMNITFWSSHHPDDNVVIVNKTSLIIIPISIVTCALVIGLSIMLACIIRRRRGRGGSNRQYVVFNNAPNADFFTEETTQTIRT